MVTTGDAAAKQERRLERRLAALALRDEMSPRAPAPERFRIATWNVNSVRARAEAVDRFLARALPDVVCLQETRTAALDDAARALFGSYGYEVAHVGDGGRNGVAVAARHPISDEERSGSTGDPTLDREARFLSCVVHGPVTVRVASVYVPHGREVGHWHFDYKLAFLDALAARLARWRAEGHAIVAGDVNVAPTDSDIFHPDAFVGCTHVTPEERAAWGSVLATGMVDLDAARWGPHSRRFTWWNHGIGYSRNLGMRIDAIAADDVLAATLDTTWIDHVERGGVRPSDHAALIADLDLTRLDTRLDSSVEAAT